MSNSERPEHMDPELVALMALGELPDPAAQEHLDSCPECRAILDELRETVAVGRSTLGAEILVEPAPRVWSAIAAELNLVDETNGAPEPVTMAPASSHRRPRRSRRRSRWIVAAALTLAAVTVGALVVTNLPEPRPTVVASADLGALPDWLGSTGTAVVEESPTGSKAVTVSIDAAEGDGYREVWLLTPDARSLVSLGVLNGSEGTFTIPDDIDLAEYRVVDVSLEEPDGDPAHSGDSIVRGTLS